MLFKVNFFTLLFYFHQDAFCSFLLSSIRVVSSAYLRLLIFLSAILIPACASSSPAFHMMHSAYKLNKETKVRQIQEIILIILLLFVRGEQLTRHQNGASENIISVNHNSNHKDRSRDPMLEVRDGSRLLLLLLLLLLSHFSRVQLCATPWMAAHQAAPSLGFSRQEPWSGLPSPSPMHACMLSCFSRVRFCVTPWTAAHQAPLFTEFSRQEYWSGLPFPSPHLGLVIC